MRANESKFPILAFLLWGVLFGAVGSVAAWYIAELPLLALVVGGSATVLAIFGGAMGSVGLMRRREEKAHQEALEAARREARHDQLTGILNRTGLMIELESSIAEARANDMVLGVLFLDLDRFKVFNDTMGHEVGDLVLQIVAERIKGAVRSTDIVARLGGDEFVVLCRGLISGDSVISVAESILKAFKIPLDLDGRTNMVSTSIGVAVSATGDERTAEELVRDADSAMFKAKRNKLGFSVFDEKQHQLSVERMEIERGLTEALRENQLTVFYQPIVNLSDRKLYAFEALVRWNHPERGLLSPGSFLDVAEEAGMLANIGDIVMREACAQAAMWNMHNPDAQSVKMSVNLAEPQLLDPNLYNTVTEVLAWAGIEPSQLILEITEDVIVDHLDSLDVLRQLKELGVGLAIDDFGTGQSSLNAIKELEMVSNLKIAEKFVTDMANSGADRAIIEAIIAMANALDMNIIAEGIETEGQIDDLTELGVSNMQGFFFSRPQAASSMDPEIWFSPNFDYYYNQTAVAKKPKK